MKKLPILRTLSHLGVWAYIITQLLTSSGCARHVEVIILKAPDSVEYAQILEMHK